MNCYYIYRFLNKDNEVVYIGKTNNLRSRMSGHFGDSGHLEKKQYKEVKRVEYMAFMSESDQHVIEIYLINKHKPKFNSSDKKSDVLTLNIDVLECWVEWSKNKKNCAYGDYTEEKYKIMRNKNESVSDTEIELRKEVDNLIHKLKVERVITESTLDENEFLKNEIKKVKSKLDRKMKLKEKGISEEMLVMEYIVNKKGFAIPI